MKGLTPGLRNLMDWALRAPPTSCGGSGGQEMTLEEERAMREGLERGLLAFVRCPGGCSMNHVVVTADGLLAYRLDGAAKNPSPA